MTSWYLYVIIKKLFCRFYERERPYIEGKDENEEKNSENNPNLSDSNLFQGEECPICNNIPSACKCPPGIGANADGMAGHKGKNKLKVNPHFFYTYFIIDKNKILNNG